jgi:hypothetical protein
VGFGLSVSAVSIVRAVGNFTVQAGNGSGVVDVDLASRPAYACR